MVLKKITLIKAAQVPLGGPIRPPGFTTEVDEDTFTVLLDRGVLAEEPAPTVGPDLVGSPEVETDVLTNVGETPTVEKPMGKKYPPLPKKTAGLNVWREYARDNEIDVRGLPEKSELMGHVIKVVTS